MATIKMREIREGEIPFAAGTAVQEDPDRPAFSGNGPDDYVCVKCGNVLAHDMHSIQMNVKLRVRCAVCDTINVAVQPEEEEEAAKADSAAGSDGA
jgi:phage FluMu protein Com